MSGGGYVDCDMSKPVVGVLLQDLSVSLEMEYGSEEYSSSLGASYVKFIEGAGCRCLPIALCQRPDYYRHIVKLVDGIVLPGGAFDLADSKGYTPSGRLLLAAVEQAAKESAKDVPVFGICLGFELMAVYFAGNDGPPFDILTPLNPRNTGWHQLTFTDDYASSSLLPKDIQARLRSNNLSHFFHQQCITQDKFSRLGSDWCALATQNVPRGGGGSETETVTVITMMESKTKPYFGVQFHPEKALYESGCRKTCADIGSAEAASNTFSKFLAHLVDTHNGPHIFSEKDFERIIDKHTPYDVREVKGIKYDYVYMFRDGDLVI